MDEPAFHPQQNDLLDHQFRLRGKGRYSASSGETMPESSADWSTRASYFVPISLGYIPWQQLAMSRSDISLYPVASCCMCVVVSQMQHFQNFDKVTNPDFDNFFFFFFYFEVVKHWPLRSETDRNFRRTCT